MSSRAPLYVDRGRFDHLREELVLRTGVAYFGNRTLRHVQRDLEDIAASGFDYVVHCFTEHDLIYNAEIMREIAWISHELGLEVHSDPWGVGGVFGGEAFSKAATLEIDACQVLADGSRMGVLCLNQPVLTELLRAWVDAAVDIGSDVIFFDEPHWYPGDLWHIGESRGDEAVRWSCRCDRCLDLFREQYGHEMPFALDDEVRLFRQDAVLRLSTDLVGYAKSKDVTTELCLLPKGMTFDLVGVPDWHPFGEIPGLDIFGTDPYWRAGDTVELEPYVRPNAAETRDFCDHHRLRDQFWIQTYNFPAGTESEVVTAIDIAIEEGLTDLAFWSYRGCEPLSKLWPANIDLVWDLVLRRLDTARNEEK